MDKLQHMVLMGKKILLVHNNNNNNNNEHDYSSHLDFGMKPRL